MTSKYSFTVFNKIAYFLLSVFFLGLAFMIYSHFLVDYSLSNLEMSLRYAESSSNEKDPIKRNIYAKVLEDLSLEQMGTNQKMEDSMVLQMSSQSLTEEGVLAPKEKAAIYLAWLFKQKSPQSIFQSIGIEFTKNARPFFEWLDSLRKKHSQEKSLQRRDLGFLLLEEAATQEKKWQFKRAEKMYRKYLSLYPLSSVKGFVLIALAQNLIRQQKWEDAKVVLAKVQVGSWAKEEVILASNLMRSIRRLEKTELSIEGWEKELDSAQENADKNRLKMLIAMACLTSFQLEKAQNVFADLEISTVGEEKARAHFYLGWLHYLRANEEEAEELFQKVISSTNADSFMNAGAKVFLGSQYAHQRAYGKSLKIYSNVAKSTARGDATSKIWNAIVELEQAGIYFNHLQDTEKGWEHLKNANAVLGQDQAVENFANTMEAVSSKNLRVFAFEALKQGQVYLAWDLFKRQLGVFPNDAWALAGLGAVYYLMKDMTAAKSYCEKAYQLQRDEYTASLKAFILTEDHQEKEAIRLFEEALVKNPSYIPANYNLATLWLRGTAKKNHGKAVTLLEGLAKGFENHHNLMASKILNNWGCGLMMMGFAESALRKFSEALKEKPENRAPEVKHNYDFVESQLSQAASGKPGLTLSK